MNKNDEVLVNLFVSIKHECREHFVCNDCKFHKPDDPERCSIMALLDNMRGCPSGWNIDSIREVINND